MPSSLPDPTSHTAALDRARRKAYWHLLPLLFVSYMIAYVDRQNVAVAKLTMTRDLPGFDNAVIGFGAGIFFLGYFHTLRHPVYPVFQMPLTALDHLIPFQPHAMLAYVSLWLYVGTAPGLMLTLK